MESDSDKLERIFDLAFETPASQREAILDRECAGDPELRRQVAAMLAGAEDERFLNAPTMHADHPVHESLRSSIAASVEQPGSRIGPYKLLQLIGEGGFGSVFMAEQLEPVSRKVALKIIKLGMDTRQVVARFEQERQALALMDHPHVARVYDAGATDTGRPYFVMELCTGEPITAYCDKHTLGISQRLELLTQVCRAVQHAHQKGLIHRDIKPGNVLVSTQDGKPHAKIIDFGIAKATASKLTEKTLFTEHRQLIGTPQYMSPEQAEGSLDIDTRTDVYSLGVLLYELLTGSTPFDGKSLRSAAYGEMQRIIREVEPPRPSTRLQQSSDTIASVAARRDIEPRRLGTIVRGELDWIVMKALEKDRQRRYESAKSLGDDLQRYLSGEAVVAAPASKIYLLRKFVRRNKGAVGAVSAVMIALLIGAVAFAWQFRRAVIERDKAQKVAEFMSETLKGVGPSVARGRDITMLKEMMDDAAARIERGELKNSPEAELRLRDTIGLVYRELVLHPQAAKMLEPAVDLARARGHVAETAQAISSLGALHHDRGQLADAERLHREALAMRQRLFPAESREVADSLNDLAIQLHEQGKLTEAEPLYRQALANWRQIAAAGGDSNDVSNVMGNLAMLLLGSGKLDEADTLLNESLATWQRRYPDGHPNTTDVLTNLGIAAQMRGDLNRSERYFQDSLAMRRKLFPPNHLRIADGVASLASVYQARGNFLRAIELQEEVLAIYRKVYSGDHVTLTVAGGNLGSWLASAGQWARGEALIAEAIEMDKRLSPGGNPNTVAFLINLSAARRAQKKLAEAELAARDAVETANRVFPADHARKAEALYVLALAASEAGELDRAEHSFRESAEMYRRVFKGDHHKTAVTLADWSNLLLRRGAAAAAEPLAREAAGMLDRVNGPKHWQTGSAHLRLGQVLLKLNQLAEAESELTIAYQIITTAQGAPASRIQECARSLVQLYEALHASDPTAGHNARAAEWKARITTRSATAPATTSSN